MDHPSLSDLPKKDPKGSTSVVNFFSGGGEMGERIRAFDWSRSPLGAVQTWSPSLVSTVRLMLNSRYPMFIWWGNELTILYNDGYAPIFGKKHPAALGQSARRVWSEIWADLSAQVDAVMREGRASWNEEVGLFMERNGFPEEVYFTWSYSPIWEEAEKIGGLFCACTEETARVLSRRRLRTLRELGERSLAAAKTVTQATAAAAAALTQNPRDLPFTLIYLLDEDGRQARLCEAINLSAGTKAAPIAVGVGGEDDVWGFSRVLQTNKSHLAGDLEGLFGRLTAGPWSDDWTRRALVLPLAKAGSQETPSGILVAGLSPRLVLDDDYHGFLDLATGHIATAIANARAYEEEKQRAEALAELDRAKTVFFSNVSHELRTPLTLMLGPLEELKAQFGRSTSSLDVSQFQQVDLVHRNGLRLLKLVNHLLDFSRIEAGRTQAIYEETDLAAFTADLASVFRSTIEKAGLSLIVDCPSLSESVFVDRDMWEKIVLNLLSNAFKFTFVGEIEVTLRPTGKHVELSVRDTGTGIPDDQHVKIFERFHRVAGTQGRTYEGTGIGLSLVQELAQLHGGSVSVESVYGKGSTFRVLIPLGKCHLPRKHIADTPNKTSASLGAMPFVEEAASWLPSNDRTDDSRPRIEVTETASFLLSPQHSVLSTEVPRPRVLLADDNADMRGYLRRLLSSQGYEIESVADGQAALDRALQNPPDIVLTDVMMPRLDGFGLLRALRDGPATKTIPVILLSARAGEESRLEGLEKGADDYLIKPFSARELLARVRSQLELARMRRKSESTLRESETYARQLLESSPDCVNVLDLDGRVISINPAGLRMLELRDDATLLNNDWTEFWTGADRAAARQAVATARGGETAFFVGACSTSTGKSKWWDVILSPVFDPDRKPKQILAVSRDITDRKQSEEARARLAAIVASSDDAIISKNLQGIITSWNRGAEKIFGYAATEAIGRPIMMLIPPQLVDEEPKILASIRRGETVARYETVRRRKDGTHIDVSLTISPILDETGSIIGASKIARDITDRKRAEETLRGLNDKLEQRVVERTQELAQSEDRLRTLATELNLAEQRERKRLAVELHDHLQQTLVLGRLVAGQGKRMAATVPTCLDVMKKMDDIFSEALTYTRTLVADLSPPVLREHGLPAALKWLGGYMKKHQIAVTVTVLEKDDLKLPEDQAVLLFQSVRELLINSAKHAGTGQADVRLERYDGQLRIEVSDQGAGFDPVAAAASAGTLDGGISSKFGLFSIQERMRALGGAFELTSALGKGTTATLVLPLLLNHAEVRDLGNKERRISVRRRAAVSLPATLDSALKKNAKIRVLLVDDHPMMRQGLRSIVAAYDHLEVVGEAGDGAEAVELAQRLNPDVVVMDINMPKMDGIEATQQIKANQSTAVVIGLSVNQSADTEQKMKAAGASTYLTKESAVDALCHAIEQAVSYKQQAAAHSA